MQLIGVAHEREEIHPAWRSCRGDRRGGLRAVPVDLALVADAGSARRFTELQPVAVQNGTGSHGRRRSGHAAGVVGRPERRRFARALRDRWRPAGGSGSGGQESRRAVDDARQEPDAGVSRRQRHPPDRRRSDEHAEGGRHRTDGRGDHQEPVVCLLGFAAGDAGLAGNAGRSGMAAVSTGRRRRAWRAWRPWSGSGCRLADSQPDAGHAAGAVRHPARRLVVPHHVVQREDRRREPGGDVPRAVDGDLRRRPAVHGLQRHQSGADGRGGQDERTVGRLQVRRRA